MATSYVAPGTTSLTTPTGVITSITLPAIPDGFLLILTAEWAYNYQSGGSNPDGTDVGLQIYDSTGGNNWEVNLRQAYDGTVSPHGINSCVSFITAKGFAVAGQSVSMTFQADMHVSWQLTWFYNGNFLLDAWAMQHSLAGAGIVDSPSITTNWDGALVFSFVTVHANGTDANTSGVSFGSGFSGIFSTGMVGAQYLCQPTAGPIMANFATDANASYSCWILAFRPYGWVQSGNWPTGSNSSATGTSLTMPLASPVNYRHTVVLVFGWTPGGVDDTVTVTDDATGYTNSYSVLARLIDANQVWGVAYCRDVRGTPSHFTVHTAASHSTLRGCAYEFGGRWLFGASASNQTTAGTRPAGTVTPIRNGALIVSPVVNEGSAGGTAVGMFQRSTDPLLPIASIIQATAVPITPNWTVTGSGAINLWALAFNPYTSWNIGAAFAGNSDFDIAPSLLAQATANFAGTGDARGFGVGQGGLQESGDPEEFVGAGALRAWADWLSSDQINDGIDEWSGEELLYRNATGLEKAMADVDAYRLTVTYAELVRDQWDPWKISARNLGYLAWAMGVNLWEDSWGDEFKRWWVANQWTFKYYRGSDLGLKMAVEAVNGKIVRLTRPPAIFYPGKKLSAQERANYVARFPQLRLYPYAPRPKLPWLNYLGGVTYIGGPPLFVRNGRFFGPLRKFYPTNYNAGGAYVRTCTVYDPWTGVETPCTVRTVVGVLAGSQKPVAYDEITMPAGKDNHFYPGRGNKQYFFPPGYYPLTVPRRHSIVLGVIDPTASRVVNVPRDGSLDITQYQAIFTTIVPSLQPINVRPEMVYTEHPWHKHQFYANRILGPGMFLCKSDAWQYLYERWYLFDPNRQPDYRNANVYMGRSRFGIRKYSAEAKIAAYWNWPKRYAYYNGYIGPGRFFAPRNTQRIDQLRRAVTASMAARDTVAINTRIKRIIQIRDVTLLDGRFTVNQWITDSS